MDRRPTRNGPTSSRRNIFAAAMGRRPHNNAVLGPNMPPANTQIAVEEPDDAIVERDAQGNYKRNVPMLPANALRGIDATGREHMEQQEAEKKLLNDYKLHLEKGYEFDQWTELKAVLAGKMDEHLQSLDEDNWMFESDGLEKLR